MVNCLVTHGHQVVRRLLMLHFSPISWHGAVYCRTRIFRMNHSVVMHPVGDNVVDIARNRSIAIRQLVPETPKSSFFCLSRCCLLRTRWSSVRGRFRDGSSRKRGGCSRRVMWEWRRLFHDVDLDHILIWRWHSWKTRSISISRWIVVLNSRNTIYGTAVCVWLVLIRMWRNKRGMDHSRRNTVVHRAIGRVNGIIIRMGNARRSPARGGKWSAWGWLDLSVRDDNRATMLMMMIRGVGCGGCILDLHGRRCGLVDDLNAGIRRKRRVEYVGVVWPGTERGIGDGVGSGSGGEDRSFGRIGAEYVVLLLSDGVNFVLVVLLVGGSSFFSLQFFFQLIEALELAVRPSRNPMFATLFLESGDADTQLFGGGVYGEVKAARQVLVRESSAAYVFGPARGWRRNGRLYPDLATFISLRHWRETVESVIGESRCGAFTTKSIFAAKKSCGKKIFCRNASFYWRRPPRNISTEIAYRRMNARGGGLSKRTGKLARPEFRLKLPVISPGQGVRTSALQRR